MKSTTLSQAHHLAQVSLAVLMMVMTGSQYSIYSTGGDPEIIEEASDLDTWISIFQDYTIETSDNYWVVIDAADGPSGGADSNGAWSFDYTIKSSRNQITSPQVKDSNYQMIATHPSDTNLVDQVDNNDNENNDDNADTNNQQSQDSGQTNIGDAQSKSDDGFGGSGSACGGIAILIIIVGVIRRRRSSKTHADNPQLNQTKQQTNHLDPQICLQTQINLPGRQICLQTQTNKLLIILHKISQKITKKIWINQITDKRHSWNG